MAVAQLKDVGVREVSVLILLVRVVHRYAALGCEAELGHDVVDGASRFGRLGILTLVVDARVGSGLHALGRWNRWHGSTLHALDGECLHDEVLRLVTVHIHTVLGTLNFQGSRL